MLCKVSVAGLRARNFKSFSIACTKKRIKFNISFLKKSLKPRNVSYVGSVFFTKIPEIRSVSDFRIFWILEYLSIDRTG